MDADDMDPGLAPGRGRWLSWRRANVLAAALVLFLAGAVAETFRHPAPAPPNAKAPRFALLLYPGTASPNDEPSDDDRDMRDWAESLRRNGHYVAADLLALGALEVERDTTWVAWTPGVIGPPMMSGLFVISAADPTEIITIAQSSPHVKRGGRIIVRPIVGM